MSKLEPYRYEIVVDGDDVNANRAAGRHQESRRDAHERGLRTNRACRVKDLTSQDVLRAAKYETKTNKHPLSCEVCGARHGSGAARVARANGGQNWIPLCRTMKCTKAYLHSTRGGAWDSPEGEAKGNRR